ncbi:hypothetical protein ABTX77_41765 [Streptomyces sp. NPDC097704]|uniref:hypothetical protein n=1 Tax=Streptomyces sp. NPDC097704 TaxID=3157101 RepID=UPI0033342D80
MVFALMPRRGRITGFLSGANGATPAGHALVPHWQEIQAMTAADAAVRSRQMLGGVETLLARVNPRRVRWRAPVLEIAMISGLNADVRLAGQGMLLQPSVFAVEAPVADAGVDDRLEHGNGEFRLWTVQFADDLGECLAQ